MTSSPLRCMVLSFLVSVASGACASPATVEGVFGGEAFRLDSQAPLSKTTASGRDIVIVLSQIENETLSTVSITVPRYESLRVGTEVEVGASTAGDDRPSLKVAVGALLVETRGDGASIISSTQNTFAEALGGTFILDGATASETSGTFRVDLDDGGYLAGSFTATPGT